MQAVAFTTGEVAHQFLLVSALEVEAAAVGARRNFVVADHHVVGAAGNFLPHTIGACQRIAALVNVGKINGFTKRDAAAVGCFLAYQHAQEGGFAGAVATDDADDSAARHAETEVIDQRTIREALGQVFDFYHLLAKARTWWDVEVQCFVAVLEFFRLQLLEAGQTCLALGLAAFRVLSYPLQFGLDGLIDGRLLFGFDFEAFLFGCKPVGIVAFVGDAVAAVEFKNPAGRVVEEVAIVGDGHHSAREVFQEALDPRD